MTSSNAYIRDSILLTFARTALPIIFLMSVNGLLTVVDAMFLGAFVGPEALAAVTLMFPLSMLMIALSTAISSGMSSLLGRRLGAGDTEGAGRLFADAHGLSLAVSAASILLFALFGWPLVEMVAGQSPELSRFGYDFISIAVWTMPLHFILAVQSDALRTEGRVGLMAGAGLLVSLANIGLNYALIVWFGLGVSGSALGTALAQALALIVILLVRLSGRTQLGLSFTKVRSWGENWWQMLALGAPRSLSFVGIALGAGATIAAIQIYGAENKDAVIAAYGLLTRLMGFAFLPLLGMSLALQGLVSNNHGAGLHTRASAGLKLALGCALAYAGLIQLGFVLFRDSLGGLFVSDPEIVAELAAILPVFTAFYFTVGPMMMLASYFQAIGDVPRSALLSLARTYLFALPLIFLLPALVGEIGIWLAAPTADVLMIALAGMVLFRVLGTRPGAGKSEGMASA